VGFPGETEGDFADTLDLVRQARFASALPSSTRSGRARPPRRCPVRSRTRSSRRRYSRLVALVEQICAEENAKLSGSRVEVLVAEGEGRKDTVTRRLSGRARDNRLVPLRAPSDGAPARRHRHNIVTGTAPHYLIADAAPLDVRRTRAGDAWAARQAAPAPAASQAPAPVLLGMPVPSLRHRTCAGGTDGTLRGGTLRDGTTPWGDTPWGILRSSPGREQQPGRAEPTCSPYCGPGTVVAVVGATATGKSDLAIDLALRLDGEVVNVDSMQLYRGMDIGTAKLPLAERRGVPHHLLRHLGGHPDRQRSRVPADHQRGHR